MANRPKPVILTVLDGWGHSPEATRAASAAGRPYKLICRGERQVIQFAK